MEEPADLAVAQVQVVLVASEERVVGLEALAEKGNHHC